jgi:hypothetical protein
LFQNALYELDGFFDCLALMTNPVAMTAHVSMPNNKVSQPFVPIENAVAVISAIAKIANRSERDLLITSPPKISKHNFLRI